MKILNLSILAGALFLASAAGANTGNSAVSKRDDLSALAAGSGVYSRSYLTDSEDGNDMLCADIVRVDVDIRPTEKRVLTSTYSKNYSRTVTKTDAVTRVGDASRTMWHAINGVDVYSITIVNGRAIEEWQRQEALGRSSAWARYEKTIGFLGHSKIKIGNCTFRKT